MAWSPEVAFVFEPIRDAQAVRQELIDKNICLLEVTYGSLNNVYLVQYPFFRDQFEHGESILTIPGKISIDILPKIVHPETDIDRKP